MLELTLFLGISDNSNIMGDEPCVVGNPRGGRTAAVLASLTGTCRRHEVDPQLYLTQLLMNLPEAKMSELSDWLPDQWKIRSVRWLGSQPLTQCHPPQ